MSSNVAIASIAVMTLGGGLATTAEGQDMTANFFADTVWEYVAETCTEAVAMNADVNAEVVQVLGNSLSDEASAISSMVELLGKTVMATQMSNFDKRTIAMVVTGAHGVVAQLEFQKAVADEDHLSNPDYLLKEDILRDRALASLALIECLWPTADDIKGSVGQSGWGSRGDELWQDAAKAIYKGECDIAFLELSRLFLDADFAGVPPTERQTFSEALLASHEPRVTPEAVAERCEEFS